MSTIIYINDNFIGLFDYLLSESIKPVKIKYGTNQEFDNEPIRNNRPIMVKEKKIGCL